MEKSMKQALLEQEATLKEQEARKIELKLVVRNLEAAKETLIKETDKQITELKVTIDSMSSDFGAILKDTLRKLNGLDIPTQREETFH
jgi:hypothetical protein